MGSPVIPIKPPPQSQYPDDAFTIKMEGGRLVIECQAVIRIPIDFQAFTWGALNKLRVTNAERKVLDCILSGLSNKEIAVQLGSSERTVKFHVSNLLAKFHVPGRQDLVRLFTSRRLTE